MVRLIWMSLLMVLMVFCFMPFVEANQPPSLTEAEVRQFLMQMDAAARARDHERIAGMFAGTASIKLMVAGSTQEIDKNQYRQMMGKTSSMITGYTYQAVINGIDIKQNRAMVTRSVRERVSSELFGTLETVSEEVVMLVKRDGRLWVTQLVSKMDYDQKF